MVLLAFLNACDDGNLTQEDISFEDVTTTQSCSDKNIIYKLKDQEALIMEIDKTIFPKELTEANDTINLNITTSTNKVVYRFYNGTVASDNICESLAPPTPVITEQWTAISGTIQIVTSANKETNTTTNATKITGYNHNIVLIDVNFKKPDGSEQQYETFRFGNYTSSTTTLPFNFNQSLTKCTSSNDVYEYNTSEALILTIDPSLIPNEVTPLNTPRTGLIGTSTNILTYRLFSNLLTSDYFCQSTTPTTPAVSELWSGVAGVSGTSGIIEVTTTTNGPNVYKHTIVLKNVSLQKGLATFNLGSSYTLGELNTTSN